MLTLSSKQLSPLEHIIKRPDTYIGSVERTTQQMWVYNSESDAMEFREVSYVPGLYKIFDEIVVNAADNKQNDENMDEIRVTVDRESGEISVWNNGRGIPIEMHTVCRRAQIWPSPYYTMPAANLYTERKNVHPTADLR